MQFFQSPIFLINGDTSADLPAQNDEDFHPRYGRRARRRQSYAQRFGIAPATQSATRVDDANSSEVSRYDAEHAA